MEKEHGINQNTLKKLNDIDFNTIDFEDDKEVKKVFDDKIAELICTGDIDEIELEQMKALQANGISYKDLKK